MLKIQKVSDLRDSQILEKMQKLIRKLPKRFANCELRTAYSNIGTYGSSRPEVLCKKVVLGNFAKLTGKHQWQSLFFNKVAGPRQLY